MDFKMNKLMFICITALLVGCVRPHDETSKVLLTFPTAPGIGVAKLDSGTVTSSKILDNGGDSGWGQADPAALADIGCYGVFVTSNTNNSKCSIGSGASFRVISFNEVAGLAAAGSSLEVEVTPGVRTFYVLGMRKGSAACSSIVGGGSLDSNNYSNPILLGQATDDIAAGSDTVSVNISLNPATLDQSKISHCAFMGSSSLSNMVFKGPASISGANKVSLNLNENTCGKYYIALSRHGQFSNGGDGGALNESTRTLRINYSSVAGSNPGWSFQPTFYTGADCAAGTEIPDGGTVTIPAGENAAEVYAIGVGAAWTTGHGGYRPFTLTDLGGAFPTVDGYINIAKFSPVLNPYIKTHFENLNVQKGQCRELDYYFTDLYGNADYYVKSSNGGSFDLKKNDGTTTVSAPSSSGFVASCASSGNIVNNSVFSTPYNTAYGVMGFKVDPTWSVSPSPYDLQLIRMPNAASSPPIYLNTTILASGLKYNTPLPNAPFASDCVVSSISPVNQDNVPLDIFGNDSNNTLKRIPFSGGAYWETGSVPVYRSSNCSGSTYPFTWIAPTIASGSSTSLPVSFRPGYVSGPLKVYMGGWPAINGKSDFEGGEATINPRWDPGLIGPNLVKWVRPAEVSGGSTYWSGIPGLESYPFSVSSAVAVGLTGKSGTPTFVSLPELGTNVLAAQFSDTDGEHIHTGGLSMSTYSVSMMVKIPTISGAARAIASFSDNTTAYKYKVLYDGLAGQVGVNYVSSAITAGWHILHVKSDSCSSSCNISYAVDGGSYVSAGTVMMVPYMDYFALGAQSLGVNSLPGNIAEVVLTKDSEDRRSLLNTYFKTKYPNAGLP